MAEVSWLYPFGVGPALPGLLMIILILFCWVWEPRASSALGGQKRKHWVPEIRVAAGCELPHGGGGVLGIYVRSSGRAASALTIAPVLYHIPFLSSKETPKANGNESPKWWQLLEIGAL